MYVLVDDKVRCHCFPQETFEKEFAAPAMKSWALLHTLGSHYSMYRFLRGPTCTPVTPGHNPRGQREVSKAYDPYSSKEAVTQTL